MAENRKIQEIPKRISGAILNSLAAGVVPRTGLEYIAIGRTHEIAAMLGDLETVESGGSAFRLISGRYGSGKSFLIQLIRAHAMNGGLLLRMRISLRNGDWPAQKVRDLRHTGSSCAIFPHVLRRTAVRLQ